MPRAKPNPARVLSLEIIRQARCSLNCGEAPRTVQRRYNLSRTEMAGIQLSRVRMQHQHRDGLGEAGVSQAVDHAGGVTMWAESRTQQQREKDRRRARKAHDAWLASMGITPAKPPKIVPGPARAPVNIWRPSAKDKPRAREAWDDGGDDATA